MRLNVTVIIGAFVFVFGAFSSQGWNWSKAEEGEAESMGPFWLDRFS
jgi:hypothetical protein